MQKLDMHGTAELTRFAVYHRFIAGDLDEETRRRQLLRASHREYMAALTSYNEFLEERRSLGQAAPDSSERTRYLAGEEQRWNQA